MKLHFPVFAAVIALLLLTPSPVFAASPSFQQLNLKNQFGEQSHNYINGGSQIDLSFTVASSDSGGKGITGLSAPFGVSAVYMHTSATPASGNPNPAAGYILVEFTPQFSGYIGSYSAFASANSGSNVNISSGLTVGQVYVITSVGTSTAANWQAVGLPTGVTPAVGVAFVATSSSAGTGTGVVQVPLATGSGVYHVEAVGSPTASDALTGSYGSYAIFQVLGATNSTTTTLVAKAPADGTVVSMHVKMLPTAKALK